MKRKFKVLLVYPNLQGMLVVSVVIGIFTRILKDAGFDVDLFDGTLYKSKQSLPTLKRAEYLQVRDFSYKDDLNISFDVDICNAFISKIDSFKPDLLVVSTVEDAFLQAIELLNLVKDRNIPHIVGGVFITAAPDKAISFPQIKTICLGEGEKAVLQVAERLRDKLGIDDVENIWIKKDDGSIIKNKIGSLIDINKILPDYSLFDEVRFYRPMSGKILKTLPLETYRGCPNRCTYCNSPMWNRFYKQNIKEQYLRRKSIDRIIYEIDYLVKEYNPELIYIIDDTFLARPLKEIKEFVKKYKKHSIPFWFNTRPETVTEEMISLLEEINCYRFNVGLECGNEEFRKKKLNRLVSNEELVEHLNILGRSSISFSINNIIGFPGETRELIFDTIELNRKISGYDSLTVSIFTPYHGTILREEAIRKGYIDPDIITTHTVSSSLLKMPQLTIEEIDGLMRTFLLYVKFPREMWREIEKAEKFDDEGNKIFKELSETYHKLEENEIR